MRPAHRDMAAQPPTLCMDTCPQGQGPREQPKHPSHGLHRQLPQGPVRCACPSLPQHLLPSNRAPGTGSQPLRGSLRAADSRLGPNSLSLGHPHGGAMSPPGLAAGVTAPAPDREAPLEGMSLPKCHSPGSPSSATVCLRQPLTPASDSPQPSHSGPVPRLRSRGPACPGTRGSLGLPEMCPNDMGPGHKPARVAGGTQGGLRCLPHSAVQVKRGPLPTSRAPRTAHPSPRQ